MAAVFHRLLLVLGMLMMLQVADAQSVAGGSSPVHVTKIGDVEYLKINDVWRKYKFRRVKGAGSDVRYESEKYRVSLRPDRQDFYVNSFHYVLSYPIREQNGELMISVVDVEKLVDPVLSPKCTGRRITTVVLDPGHGGHDSGAVSSYAREKDCNLRLALRVRQKLVKCGFKVVMTRDADYFLTLQQRVAIANKTPDCLFVSLHHNSGRSAASGIETFTLAPHGTTSPFARTRRTEDLAGNDQDSENIALATAVHSRAIRNSQAIDRGIQRARFSVLCTIKRPAILFEGGFVSNPEEGVLITQPKYQDMLATSITEGIRSFCATICEKNSKLKVRSTTSGGASLGNNKSAPNAKGKNLKTTKGNR